MSGSPTGWNSPKTNWVTSDPIVTTDLNRIEGNANATEVGARTLDQALAGRANVGTLRQLLSWFAGLFRAITGAANWWDAPATTLAAANAHHGRVDNPHAVTAGQVGAAPASLRGTATIPTSGWVGNAGDYPLRVNIALSGVHAAHVVHISLDVDQHDTAVNAGLCPTVVAYAGGVTIFTLATPAVAIPFSFIAFS